MKCLLQLSKVLQKFTYKNKKLLPTLDRGSDLLRCFFCPIRPIFPFCTPPKKTWKQQRFSDVSRGYIKGTLAWNAKVSDIRELKEMFAFTEAATRGVL